MLSARKCQAEIVAQAGNAAVLDAGLGLHLKRGDHRARVDLRDLAAHVELGAFLGQHARQALQFVFIDSELFGRTIQQRAGRQLVTSMHLGHGGLVLQIFVSAIGDLGNDRFRSAVWRRSRGGAWHWAAIFFQHALDASLLSRLLA